MLKRIYSKYEEIGKDVKDVILKDEQYDLKQLLYLFAIPGTKIQWKGQKKRFRVIARNDNFIIITRPYNPKKTFEYSILDLEYMECNKDNYYCRYNYQDIEECKKALEELQQTREEEKKTKIKSDTGLQLSRRGMANIYDMITEIWIEVKVKQV